MTTKLSLDRLKTKIMDRGVTIDKILVEGQDIRFILCKTKLKQKIFAIYVNPKYTFKGYITAESFPIAKVPQNTLPLSKRQMEYINSIRGSNFPYDTLSISSGVVIHYKSADNITFYTTPDYHTEEEENDEDDDDFITKLEKKTMKIKKKADKKDLLPKEGFSKGSKYVKDKKSKKKSKKHSSSSSEESKKKRSKKHSSEEESKKKKKSKKHSSSEESKGELSSELSTEPSSKVVSEEEPELSQKEARPEGSPEDDLLIEAPEKEDSFEGSMEEVKPVAIEFEASSSSESVLEDNEESLEDKKDLFISNITPGSIREKDVVIGVIYISIDLSLFLKQTDNLEEELSTFYTGMDLNERDLRLERLRKIKERCYFMLAKADDALALIQDKETKVKADLGRLSVAYVSTSVLQEKISKDPKKYGEVTEETQEVKQQIAKTIEELNLELLRLRDEADEILINCSDVVEELVADLMVNKEEEEM